MARGKDGACAPAGLKPAGAPPVRRFPLAAQVTRRIGWLDPLQWPGHEQWRALPDDSDHVLANALDGPALALTGPLRTGPSGPTNSTTSCGLMIRLSMSELVEARHLSLHAVGRLTDTCRRRLTHNPASVRKPHLRCRPAWTWRDAVPRTGRNLLVLRMAEDLTLNEYFVGITCGRKARLAISLLGAPSGRSSDQPLIQPLVG